MPHYRSLIAATDFRTLLAYLYHPQSPIDYHLHVDSRLTLLELAEKLDRPVDPTTLNPVWVAETLQDYTRRGQLRLTCRHPSAFPEPSVVIPAAAIGHETPCSGLYLPPFYLSLTEGVFESERARVSPQREAAEIPPSVGSRLKF